MGYVAAGYGIALGTLALYALSLVVRRRRLERAISASPAAPDGLVPDAGAPPLLATPSGEDAPR
jgi:uncharacterized protein (TIGR03382 family)